MTEFKDMKSNNPVWPFTPSPDVWGYINNPRWEIPPGAPFIPTIEAQIWSDNQDLADADESKEHIPCGHWHKHKEVVVEFFIYAVGTSTHKTDNPSINYSGWRIEKRSTLNLGAVWILNQFQDVLNVQAYNIAVLGDAVYVGGYWNVLVGSTQTHTAAIKKLSSSDGQILIDTTLLDTWEAGIYNGSFTRGMVVDATGLYVLDWVPNLFENSRVIKMSLDFQTVLWDTILPTSRTTGGFFGYTYDYLAQDDNYIYACYTKFREDDAYGDWCVLKLDKSDGSIVWIKVLHFGATLYSEPASIKVDSTGVYTGGTIKYDIEDTPSDWYIEKRSLDTGDVIWSYQISNTHIDDGDLVYSVSLDDEAVYVSGNYGWDGTNKKFLIEKRRLDTGVIIAITTDTEQRTNDNYKLLLSTMVNVPLVGVARIGNPDPMTPTFKIIDKDSIIPTIEVLDDIGIYREVIIDNIIVDTQ